MQRNRIMNPGADTLLSKVDLQRFAIQHADHVEVIDVAGSVGLQRGNHAFGFAEEMLIALGGFLTPASPVRQMTQLYGEKARLQGIKATVVALNIVIILLGLAMIADHAHLAGDFFVIGGGCSGFAASPEILARVEAESTDLPDGAGFAPAIFFLREIFRAVSLAGIFHN